MSGQIAPFRRPRPVDADVLKKQIVTDFRNERQRRRTVDDEWREQVQDAVLPAGTFRYADISIKDPLQEVYFNRYGGEFVNPNSNYRCRHCGMEFGMAIPPEICPRCHQYTYFGEMVRDGVFKK